MWYFCDFRGGVLGFSGIQKPQELSARTFSARNLAYSMFWQEKTAAKTSHLWACTIAAITFLIIIAKIWLLLAHVCNMRVVPLKTASLRLHSWYRWHKCRWTERIACCTWYSHKETLESAALHNNNDMNKRSFRVSIRLTSLFMWQNQLIFFVRTNTGMY